MSEMVVSTSWLTALIQIGIPSAVTVISLAFASKTTRAAHKKDITIAELTLRGKLRVDSGERRAGLVKEIAEAVSSVENAIGKHSGVFRRNTHVATSSQATEVPDELALTYADLCHAIDAACGARAKVNLLGNSKISGCFELFLQDFFGFQHQANPAARVGAAELSENIEPVMSRRKTLMQMLSALYLEGSEAADEQSTR